MKPVRVLAVVIALYVSHGLLCPDAQARLRVINDKAGQSASGDYSLLSESTITNINGDMYYRLDYRDSTTWELWLPFSIDHAVVAEDGTTIGIFKFYGEQKATEISPLTPPLVNGTYTIVVGRNGEYKLAGLPAIAKYPQETQPENVSNIGLPIEEFILTDVDHDRFIIRQRRFDKQSGNMYEQWYLYRLSTNEYLKQYSIQPSRSELESGNKYLDAYVIPGVPLILIQWIHYYNRENMKPGRYSLVDFQGETVWKSTSGGEISNNITGILSVQRPGRFEVAIPTEQSRVAYEVTRTNQDHPQWSVREIGREALEPDWQHDDDDLYVSSQVLGTIPLQVSSPPSRSVGQYASFDIDGEGRVGVIDTNMTRFVLHDATGTILKQIPIDDPEAVYSSSTITWLSDNQWIATQSSNTYPQKSRIHILSTDESRVTATCTIESSITSIAALGADRFAILEGSRYEGYSKLIAFDLEGNQLWSKKQDISDYESIHRPSDVATTPDGSVAVLDMFVPRIQFFDKQGNYLQTEFLPKEFERFMDPHLDVSQDNGFVVTSTYTIYLLDRNLRNVAQFTPRYSNGRRLSYLQNIRVGQDGKLWGENNGTLYHLSERGVVDKHLRNRPALDELGEIAGATCDNKGRLYLVSSGTGSVHVFRPDGSLVHICLPLPTDFPLSLDHAVIKVDSQGNVFVQDAGLIATDQPNPIIQFAPDGKRIGHAIFSGKISLQDVYFPPKQSIRWEKSWDRIRRIDPDGSCPVCITQRPDGQPLRNPQIIAFAPNGNLAVLSRSPRIPDHDEWFADFYDADGKPVRTLTIHSPSIATVLFTGKNLLYFPSPYSYNLSMLDIEGNHKVDVRLNTMALPSWDMVCVSPDNRELWLLIRNRVRPYPGASSPIGENGPPTIHRYTIPDLHTTEIHSQEDDLVEMISLLQ